MLIAPSGNPCPSCVVDPGSMVDYRYWSPRIHREAPIHRDKRGDLPVRSESAGMTGGVAGLANGAAGAPVDAVGGAGEEVLVDQVAAQGAVVVEDGLEDLVHHRLGVAAAGLEGLGQLIEQHPPAGTLGRHGGDPAVPDERPQRGRRVGEQTVRIAVHHQPSMARGQPLVATEMSQAVPFRGWPAMTTTCALRMSSRTPPTTSRPGGSRRSTCGSRPSPI